MTQRELDRLVRRWQRRLRLTDWAIEAKLVPLNEMEEIQDRGEVDYFEDKQVAAIRLVDPAHRGQQLASRLGHSDVELDVVHELLHIRVAGWETKRGTAAHVDLEQAIHALSLALLGR